MKSEYFSRRTSNVLISGQSITSISLSEIQITDSSADILDTLVIALESNFDLYDIDAARSRDGGSVGV